jgi:glycosyltransferase involved in cell wall biosynthesis
VPNSFSQGRYLIGLNKAWKKKVIPITNYTAIDEYVPAPVMISDRYIHIGVISRIFPQKNYERFCEMLCMVKQRSHQKFIVSWYGDRQDGDYLKGSQHIHDLIEKLNIGDVIEVKQAVKNVAELMPRFHFMCLPSLFEGFSNSLSEYICSGKPVVCSDISDNSLMVHEGDNGYLFDPKDTESMCSAFTKMLSLTQDKLEAMGKRSREIAEELFDKEAFVNKYIELIEG